MITIDLHGKHAVITGGSSGIGAAIAKTLVEAGASVTILSRSPVDLFKQGLSQYQSAINHISLDVSDSGAVSQALTTIDHQYGIDIVVCSAGMLRSGTLTETSDEEWRAVMSVNVDGVFHIMRDALRIMLEKGTKGKIVVIGSISGLAGNPGFSAYCTSKGALLNMVRQAGIDYAPHKININSIAPGFVETEMTRLYSADVRRYLEDLTPSGEWASPQQIANATLFLCSELSSHIYGQTLAVDGGWTAGVHLSP